MKPGTLLLTAALFLTGSAAYTPRGDSPSEPGRKSASVSSDVTDGSGLSLFPRGRFDYVEARLQLRLPQSSNVDLEAFEEVKRETRGQWLRAGISHESPRGMSRTDAFLVEGSLPRLFDLEESTASAAHRSFKFGNDQGSTFTIFGDLDPTMNLPLENFGDRLKEQWGSVRFTKLPQPYLYSLRLERATPAGILSATIVYRNTGRAARDSEIADALAVAAATDVL